MARKDFTELKRKDHLWQNQTTSGGNFATFRNSAKRSSRPARRGSWSGLNRPNANYAKPWPVASGWSHPLGTQSPNQKKRNHSGGQIRELMEREAGILRERTLPEKYVRPDAIEFFKGDLEKRIREHEENSRGLKFNQSHGPRVLVERQQLEAERQSFHTKFGHCVKLASESQRSARRKRNSKRRETNSSRA